MERIKINKCNLVVLISIVAMIGFFIVFAIVFFICIQKWQKMSNEIQRCVKDYVLLENTRNAANHTINTAYLYADVDGIELYLTSLYEDAHLLAYYRLENNIDSKGVFTLTDKAIDSSSIFQSAKFNNGLDSGSSWQANTGRYNTDFTISTGTTPVSISAWVSINSQPPDGLDGDFVEAPIANHTVDYVLGYG